MIPTWLIWTVIALLGLGTLLLRFSFLGLIGQRPLPDWAAEFDCVSWGQFFLKYVIAHPAVTCVIPATSKVKHLVDNMGAGHGRLPDATMRARMVAYFESL